jgi:hypothetical protein
MQEILSQQAALLRHLDWQRRETWRTATQVGTRDRRFEFVSAVGGRSSTAMRQARGSAVAEKTREAAPAPASAAEVEPW